MNNIMNNIKSGDKVQLIKNYNLHRAYLAMTMLSKHYIGLLENRTWEVEDSNRWHPGSVDILIGDVVRVCCPTALLEVIKND